MQRDLRLNDLYTCENYDSYLHFISCHNPERQPFSPLPHSQKSDNESVSHSRCYDAEPVEDAERPYGAQIQWYHYQKHHYQHMQKYGHQEYEKIRTKTTVVDSVLDMNYNCHTRIVQAFTINTRPSLFDIMLSQALNKILTNVFKKEHPATALAELQGFWYGFSGKRQGRHRHRRRNRLHLILVMFF
ncbi:hypothetical protein CAPTEDRAFT_204624 [Capitella teleta]|uniref:Uncharacterized protein n=1 Tax=Capitella teleta TaxID=283909 RepID=R7UKF4_CAPTE|nr:hypothetical protein CAPTEDRAFT_204624 [Capitella teleta]|eukprot:ELU07019.1 hypothetical protein CAPTEDRAFT_204624 [Capitella teleta]